MTFEKWWGGCGASRQVSEPLAFGPRAVGFWLSNKGRYGAVNQQSQRQQNGPVDCGSVRVSQSESNQLCRGWTDRLCFWSWTRLADFARREPPGQAREGRQHLAALRDL